VSEPAGQAPSGYRDLVTRARNEQGVLVDVECRDGYAVVRMNEPAALNPLNGPVTIELLEHLRQMAEEVAIRAVILTGADPAVSAREGFAGWPRPCPPSNTHRRAPRRCGADPLRVRRSSASHRPQRQPFRGCDEWVGGRWGPGVCNGLRSRDRRRPCPPADGPRPHRLVPEVGLWLAVQVAPRGALGLHMPASSVTGADEIDPEYKAQLDDSVALVLLVVLERLTSAGLWRLYSMTCSTLPSDEIAPIVRRSPAAARQLASRAAPGAGSGPARHTSHAPATGRRRPPCRLRGSDFGALLAMLDRDVVIRADDAAVQMGLER
jgi:hypothetical protein